MTELWDVLDENGIAAGRLHERGQPMSKGEYHLTVYVWIENHKGEYLISQRSPNKSFPNMWECTGGNAIAGDDSLTTALKEAYEELGVVLNPQTGQIVKHQIRGCSACDNCLGDVWLFRQNIDISAVRLAADETCAAMWASRDTINRMIHEGTFTTWGICTSLDDLFPQL